MCCQCCLYVRDSLLESIVCRAAAGKPAGERLDGDVRLVQVPWSASSRAQRRGGPWWGASQRSASALRSWTGLWSCTCTPGSLALRWRSSMTSSAMLCSPRSPARPKVGSPLKWLPFSFGPWLFLSFHSAVKMSPVLCDVRLLYLATFSGIVLETRAMHDKRAPCRPGYLQQLHWRVCPVLARRQLVIRSFDVLYR